METLQYLFDLPPSKFIFLLSIILVISCVFVFFLGVCIKKIRTYLWPDYRVVGIRYYVDVNKTNARITDSDSLLEKQIFYCPQCYVLSSRAGSCPSEEHEIGVALIPGSCSQLEYLQEMQKLIHPNSSSEEKPW